MHLQHSGGLSIGYKEEADSRSGYEVLSLIFREVCGGFGGLWGFLKGLIFLWSKVWVRIYIEISI